MAKPNARETELISQFRTRVSDLNLEGRYNEDYDLVRWIRARNYNLNEAEKMIREHMKWRKENDMDNIFDWTPPKRFQKELPFEFLGFDYENSPVLLASFGKWDLKKVAELGENETLARYCDQIYELVVKQMEGKLSPSGYPITQCVPIVDLKGMTYKTLASVGVIQLIIQMARNFEVNRPEMVKALYLINGSAVYAALYSMSKPLMSAATVSKLHVFSTDVSKWKPVLQSRFPSSILPPSLGGSNQIASDETTAEVVEEVSEEDETSFLSVYVPAGDKLEINFGVDEGNSTITWAFKTEKYDIAFAVNCDGKAYIEKTRVNSHEELQEGIIKCETPGDYIFTFDNTYSRLRVKHLTYRVDLQTPGELRNISF